MARHDFILDVTLTLDREISGVFAAIRKRPTRRGCVFGADIIGKAGGGGGCGDYQRGRLCWI